MLCVWMENSGIRAKFEESPPSLLLIWPSEPLKTEWSTEISMQGCSSQYLSSSNLHTHVGGTDAINDSCFLQKKSKLPLHSVWWIYQV